METVLAQGVTIDKAPPSTVQLLSVCFSVFLPLPQVSATAATTPHTSIT